MSDGTRDFIQTIHILRELDFSGFCEIFLRLRRAIHMFMAAQISLDDK
jgi:hypothetical protein